MLNVVAIVRFCHVLPPPWGIIPPIDEPPLMMVCSCTATVCVKIYNCGNEPIVATHIRQHNSKQPFIYTNTYRNMQCISLKLITFLHSLFCSKVLDHNQATRFKLCFWKFFIVFVVVVLFVLSPDILTT